MVILLIAGYGVNRSMNSSAELSDLALRNVVALADVENPDPGEGGEGDVTTWQIGSKTISYTVKETESSGWTWEISLQLWFLNVQATNEEPPHSTERTETITFKCCRAMGELATCVYEKC